jgi:hypothetical protein
MRNFSIFVYVVIFNMLKMMKMHDQKMVMDPIHQNHLTSKVLVCFIKQKRNNKTLFRKMFIGGLSWQTAPGNYSYLFYIKLNY